MKTKESIAKFAAAGIQRLETVTGGGTELHPDLHPPEPPDLHPVHEPDPHPVPVHDPHPIHRIGVHR